MVRNPSWTPKEDKALCSSWLRVSEDAVIGIDQQSCTMVERIMEEFVVILDGPNNRKAIALMNHWSIVQGHHNKFSGYVLTIGNSVSGCNNDAVCKESLFK